ncbi:MAG: hypothetical protein COS89_02055 [Deltaproteobacteria bacterium CG07_land_8_20_14_0_80_38_7]|nr:MAG: hypothetical protein COS89_02055 [Deltaproteobacteria bacterium CG07_land_8_20_14_0_80_38_7]
MDEKSTIPKIGEPTDLYSGWSGGDTYRPIVLNNVPNCSDPDHWESFTPQEGLMTQLKTHIKEQFHIPKNIFSHTSVTSVQAYESKKKKMKLVVLFIEGKDPEQDFSNYRIISMGS